MASSLASMAWSFFASAPAAPSFDRSRALRAVLPMGFSGIGSFSSLGRLGVSLGGYLAFGSAPSSMGSSSSSSSSSLGDDDGFSASASSTTNVAMVKNVLSASGGCVGETSSDTSSLLLVPLSSSHRNIHAGATRSFASSATLGGGDTTTYPSKKEPDVTEFTKLRDAVFAKAMANYTAHGGEVVVSKKKRRKRGKYNQRGEMHKKVHVILREKVEQLGDPYEKVTVAAGFMRNYLFPRGHAIYATKLNEAWAEQMREQTSTEVDASSAPASKATTQPGATTTLPRNVRKTIVKRLTNPLIFVRSVDLTDRRTLDKPITRGELVEACRSAMSLEVDPLSLIYVPGHDETKAQEVPSPTAELEQLVMTTAGYHEFKIDWGEAHAQADSPMKLMIVIEPTKEQQATFDAEDAARAEFGAE